MSFFSKLFECRHKTLTPVQEDGRQYCTTCNKAFIPDCSHQWEMFGRDRQKCKRCGEIAPIQSAPCQHEWAEYSRSEKCNTMTGNTIGWIIILRCKHCGELKQFDAGL